MRSIFITLGALVLAAPATAQSWEEYSDPDYAFSVSFPAKPLIQNTTYQVWRQPLGSGACVFGPAKRQRVDDNHR